MERIHRTRRERFGGVVFSENPACLLFVNEAYANRIGIQAEEGLPEEHLSAPLDAHLSLTERCLKNCPGCYTPRGEVDMDRNHAKSILEHLAGLGVFTVAFGGGEPFLHPHLFQIAEDARAVAIVPNITTSGMLIREDNAAACRVFGNIHLSCHRSTDLEDLTRAVHLLQRSGIEPGLNILASRDTLPAFDAIFGWCRKHRIARALILRFKTTAANRAQAAELTLTPEQEAGVFPLIRQMARRHGVIPLIDCSLFPAVAIHKPPASELERYDVNGCKGGNAFIAVTTSGQYKPCSFWPQVFGDVLQLTRESWRTDPNLQAFRSSSSCPNRCQICSLLPSCGGGCRLEEKTLCDRIGSSV